jgi:hypothetical protein
MHPVFPLPIRENLCGSIGFCLGHQARFANACFTGQQGDLPLTTERLIDQCMKGREVTDAVNEYRADNWFMKRCPMTFAAFS